jgi:hypothetical protein
MVRETGLGVCERNWIGSVVGAWPLTVCWLSPVGGHFLSDGGDGGVMCSAVRFPSDAVHNGTSRYSALLLT